MVKNPPAMQEMQETQVQSLDWKDHPEESMATQSSILAGKIPWTEEPGRLRSVGSHSQTAEVTEHAHTHRPGTQCGVTPTAKYAIPRTWLGIEKRSADHVCRPSGLTAWRTFAKTPLVTWLP